MNASQTILDVLENPEFANEKLATAKYSLDGTAFHDTLSILENPTEKALFVKTLTNKMTATEQACAQILKTLISPIQTPSIVQGGMGVVHPGIGANQEEGGPDTEYVSQDKE